MRMSRTARTPGPPMVPAPVVGAASVAGGCGGRNVGTSDLDPRPRRGQGFEGDGRLSLRGRPTASTPQPITNAKLRPRRDDAHCTR
jgi:hypothetical protein